jgi:hypothetical protein
MKKFSSEIVFSSKDNTKSKQISQQLKTGLLRKIAPKIYTTQLEEAASKIIYRNRYQIASHLFPGAIISHRTAFEGVLETLYISGYERTLLENLQPSRQRGGVRKTVQSLERTC